MSEVRSLRHLARDPLYNTAAVAQATGVPADTFRAWERRYGMPCPYRTLANQRLYAEWDIGIVGWLRERTNEGMTISQAIRRLRLELPEAFTTELAPSSTPSQQPAPTSPIEPLHQRLFEAALLFDMRGIERVIDEALARWSVGEFCTSFVEPVLDSIASRSERRVMDLAAERFMVRLLERRLGALATLVSVQPGRGTILLANVLSESNEAWLLGLSIALSRYGWRVVEIGGDISSNDLTAVARAVHPELICLSALTSRAIDQAVTVAQQLDRGSDQPPVIIADPGDATGHARAVPHARVVTGGSATIASWIDEWSARRGR